MNPNRLLLIGLMLLSIASSLQLHAQSSAFTYQGHLSNGSGLASGRYDLSFELFDDATAGASQGALTNTAVAVSNGLFTIALDFGPSVFDGNDRWLEIGATTNGGVMFQTLSPRQQLTATPYAIKAANAANADAVSGTVSANQLTGTISSNHIAAGSISSAMLTEGAVGTDQLADDSVTASKIGGAFLPEQIPDLDASRITSGTLASPRLAGNYSSKVEFSNAGNDFTGTHRLPSAQPFVHQISASGFVPDSPSEGYNRGAGLISPSGDTTLQFHAPLHLPQGALVTKLVGVFYDIGSEDFTDIDLRLRYFTTSSLSDVIMAEVLNQSTVGLSGGRYEFEDATINQSTIDNLTRAYSLDATFTVDSATSNTRFYGVRVEYTLQTLAP